MIYRPFWEWLESFLNYFCKLARTVDFNYVPRLLFDSITETPVDRYFEMDLSSQGQTVQRLFEYWCAAYTEGIPDLNVRIIRLLDVDRRSGEIGAFLQLKEGRTKAAAWRRASPEKNRLELDGVIDVSAVSIQILKLESKIFGT